MKILFKVVLLLSFLTSVCQAFNSDDDLSLLISDPIHEFSQLNIKGTGHGGYGVDYTITRTGNVDQIKGTGHGGYGISYNISGLGKFNYCRKFYSR